MGIHGIYQEIGPGDRIALSKLAVDKFEETGSPLRIAIDTSIWLFQIQASKGGTNPALRTFYYRLLRLLSLSIHPLFVFDGPNKPPFKRNKRTGPNVASIPEFLAKQLLKQFGFPFHLAPGEAEAECALLQREGIVDAVLSEDVDTLMFGSRVSLRNWSAEMKSAKVPTHVNLYDSEKTKSGPSGLDREGMILVALMSGGDYSPEGIPGCGPKTACEAARAGFGARLCAIAKRDTTAIQEWRENLAHELKTNESKFFKRKHKALAIPEEFPRADILGYYTNPAISSKDSLERLKRNLRWDQELNFPELRAFTADAFEWVKVTGAKKFIRNLAPALLVRHLRMRGQEGALLDNLEVAEAEEAKLVTSIHGRRQHPSTDNTPELRVAFSPHDIVNIDLDAEEPDDEPEEDEDEDEEDIAIARDGDGEAPKKPRPYLYDPTKLDKVWLFESFVKIGAPLIVQDWEEAQRKKVAPKPAKVTKPRATEKATGTGGMQKGALDRFARISKAGVGPPPAKRRSPTIDKLDLSGPKQGGMQNEPSNALLAPSDRGTHKSSKALKSPPRTTKEPVYIDILSSSPVAPCKESESNPNTLDEHYLSTNVTKRARNSKSSQPSPGNCTDALPSQSTVTANAFHTSPIVRHVSTSAAARPIRESEPLLQGLSETHKTTWTRSGVLRARQPSTPPQGGPRGKRSTLVSPSKRQMTLEETFRFSRGGTPSRIRHDNFLAAPEHETPAIMASVEEVEELDLSRFSPRASSGKTSRSLCDSRTQAYFQLPRPNGKASGGAACGTSKRSEDRALRGTVGNEAVPKVAKAMSGSKKASLATGPRPASLEKSAELRRSPRQHRAMPSPKALGEPAKELSKKQVIKLRESLVGSWKLVDASTVEVMDMTGDGPRQDSSGRKHGEGLNGKRKAWRQSEVEVLDLTSD